MKIIEHLQAEGRRLSQEILEAQYRDPFWAARFGARGRRFADEDSDFHLRYLARALATDDARVLVRYARWLRELLATRGMCTRHLADNFFRLERKLLETGWAGAEAAAGYVRQARESLRYADGPAAEVQALEAPPGSDLATVEDPSAYLSYLADALALGNPATLVAHVRWTTEWLTGLGEPIQEMRRRLEALARLLRERGVGAAPRLFLDEARATLGIAAPGVPLR